MCKNRRAKDIETNPIPFLVFDRKGKLSLRLILVSAVWLQIYNLLKYSSNYTRYHNDQPNSWIFSFTIDMIDF